MKIFQIHIAKFYLNLHWFTRISVTILPKYILYISANSNCLVFYITPFGIIYLSKIIHIIVKP